MEEYLIDWSLSEIRKKYINESVQAMDYLVLDGETVSPSEIVESCQMFPVLSEKRVVWIKNFRALKSVSGLSGYGEEGIREITSYLENPNENTIAVFSNSEIDGRSKLAKTLKKTASIYEYGTLTEAQLISFASKRFREAKIDIDAGTMRELIDRTGYLNRESEYRLYNFKNDIDKLIAYNEKSVITKLDIDTLIEGDGDTFIFNLIDGISGNDKTKALEILHNKMKDDPYGGIPIALAIASQVELMFEIKEFVQGSEGLYNAHAISKYTNIHRFRIEKAMAYASKYPMDKLRNMLKGIYEAYGSMVTGVLNPQMALEMFIAKI
ncbi:MAG: DNA polymerase III subunit delta [Hornefia sp.]|nr:DNA polymerase III subunit delta [Hornefia sp.]